MVKGQRSGVEILKAIAQLIALVYVVFWEWLSLVHLADGSVLNFGLILMYIISEWLLYQVR